MFLVNSRSPQFSATFSRFGREVLHANKAILLPKLRMYFAEFLNHSYLALLGILYPPTCVGLGYGHRINSLEDFLGSIGSMTSPYGSASCLRLNEIRICLDLALRTYPRTTNAWAHLPSSVPPLLSAIEKVSSTRRSAP